MSNHVRLSVQAGATPTVSAQPGASIHPAWKARGCAVALCALALGAGGFAIADNQKGEKNGVTFESGGVGLESAADIKSHAGQYSLMMTFAWREGNYLADVNVQIQNQRGETTLDIAQAGPFLLVNLPKGQYTIKVDRGGRSFTRRIAIGGAQAKTVFYWPKDEAEATANPS